MQQKPILNKLRILVTRPAHQAKILSELILQLGGQPILFPVIEIKPLPLDGKIVNLLDDISHLDYAVFISPNAVEYGIPELLKTAKLINKIK